MRNSAFLKKIALSFSISLFFTGFSFANHIHSKEIESLWLSYQQSRVDSVRISTLYKIANFHYETDKDIFLVDSISQLALDIAESSYNDLLLINAYNRYLELNDNNVFHIKASEIIQKLETIPKLSKDPENLWRTYINVSHYCIANYDFEKALEKSNQAFAIAGNLESEIKKASSYISLAKSLEGSKKRVEAFRNYLSALTIAENSENKELLAECYSLLSKFYLINKIYDKAKDYKYKHLEIIQQSDHVDSLQLMLVKLDFEEISFNFSNRVNNKIIGEIFTYSIKHNNYHLKRLVLSLLRSHLVKAHNLSGLHKFYFNDHPDELQKLKASNYTMYLRIMAFLNEYEQEIDSAFYYFNEAEQLMQMSTNKIMVSHFLYRYGEFLERHNKKNDAKTKYKNALKMATESKYIPFALNASLKLEKIYAKQEDYTNAYRFAHINKTLSDSLSNIAKQNELFEMELENQQELRVMALNREAESTKRRHSLQYTAIVILIITAFVVLILLGRYNVPRWGIEALGFFAFIFAFEFIILIADHKIHHMTHGEPWKILLIKIFLIGILLPLHHYLEGKAVSFVIHNKRFSLKNTSFSLKDFFRKYILKDEEH